MNLSPHVLVSYQLSYKLQDNNSLKEKEVERQSLLNGTSAQKNKKKKNEHSDLTEWEEKLKQIEESK